MSGMTRRDLPLLLSAFATMATTLAGDEEGLPHLHSRVYLYDKLPVTYSSGGAATRPIVKGKLPTGETVELHETTLLPQQMPHPAHRHVHTEFMLIREGMLEFILEGRSERLGPGGVAYAASGEFHGLKNVGSTPATYFVMAIGVEPKM